MTADSPSDVHTSPAHRSPEASAYDRDASPSAAGTPDDRRRRRRPLLRGRGASGSGVIIGIATVPTVAIVGTLALVAYLGFRLGGRHTGQLTLDNYAAIVRDGAVFEALVNTVVMVVVTVVVAVVLGVPLAWLVERTDLGFRRAIHTAMVVRLLFPGFLTAMGWVFMFHPRVGFVNQWGEDWLGLPGPMFDVVTLYGMGIVQGIALSALVFVMVGSSLRTMDTSLEESARMSGASTLQILRRVTLPLLAPSLFGTMLFVGAIAVAVFDIPLIIGLADNIVVFSTYIYLVSNPVQGGLPDYGTAAAFSTLMIAVALMFSYWYTRILKQARRFEVVSGKAYKPTAIALGRWRRPALVAVVLYFVVSTVIPLLFIAWVSLVPFVQPPSSEALEVASLDNFRDLDWDRVRLGLGNSIKVMVAAPTITLVASLAISWVVLRSRLRARMAYDFVAFLPQAVPSIVFALGGLLAALYWTQGWYDLYGSVTLIVAVTAVIFVAFATRVFNGALIQISGELEEAAAMSGATTWMVARRVTLPLLRPVIIFTWLWLSLLTLRELTVPTLLGRGPNDTVAVVAWSAWEIGRAGQAAAISLVMTTLFVPIVGIYLWLTRNDRDNTAAAR